MNKKKKYITQKEMASLKNVTIGCVSNWVRRGNIKKTVIYGKILVDPDTLVVRDYAK